MFDIDQFIDSCESMKINEWDYEIGMEGALQDTVDKIIAFIHRIIMAIKNTFSTQVYYDALNRAIYLFRDNISTIDVFNSILTSEIINKGIIITTESALSDIKREIEFNIKHSPLPDDDTINKYHEEISSYINKNDPKTISVKSVKTYVMYTDDIKKFYENIKKVLLISKDMTDYARQFFVNISILTKNYVDFVRTQMDICFNKCVYKYTRQEDV